MTLEGTNWLVTQLDRGDGELDPVIEGTTLTFGAAEERVHGSAGCNRYFGPAIIGETVAIGPLATTMMFCSYPEGVMDQERWFLTLLSEVDSVEVEEQVVRLSSGGKVTVVMEPLPAGIL
jgi:heat shock protein HslJ